MLSTLFVLSAVLMQSSSGLVQGDVFEGDSRLAATISIRADAEPIKQVLKKVTDQTGVILDSTDYVGKQNVILLMKEKKASDVLKTLAEHFDFSWEKTSTGYKLIQSDKQKQAERQQYQKNIIDQYQSIRESARKGLEKSEKVSFSENKKRMDELNEQITKLRDEFYGKHDDYANITEKEEEAFGSKVRPLYSELRKLQQESDPFAKLACRVILDLNDSRILELDSRHRLVFSTHPTHNQLRLSSSAYQYAVQGLNDYTLRLQLAHKKMEAEMQNVEKEMDEQDYAYTGVSDYDIYGEGFSAKRAFSVEEVGAVRVTITAITTSEVFPTKMNRPNLDIAIIGKDGNVLAQNYDALRFQDEYRFEHYAEELDPVHLPKEEVKTDKVAILDDLIPETEALLDFYRSMFADSEFGGMLSLFFEFMKPGNRYEPLNVFGKLLNEVASATKQDMISDCHDTYLALLFSNRRFSPNIITLRRFLDSLSNNFSIDWKFQDGLISLKSQEWALKRAINVDRDVAFTIRDIAVNNSGMSIEDMARVSQMITDRQSESPILLFVFGPTISGFADESKAKLYFHRFWNVLDNGSKNALMNGQNISYSVLNLDAKRFLGEYLYRNGEVLADGSDFDGYMQFESYYDDTEAESFLKEATDLLNAEGFNEGSNDSEITQRLPLGIPPDTMIKLFYKEDDALTVKMNYLKNELRWTVPISEYVLLKGQEVSDEIDMSISSDVKPAKIDRYNFVFFFTPRDATLHSARYTYSSPSAQFISPKSLPPHIIQKIEKAEKNWIERRKHWHDDGDGGN